MMDRRVPAQPMPESDAERLRRHVTRILDKIPPSPDLAAAPGGDGPARMWLAPKCEEENREGRTWCADDAWGACPECGAKPVLYVRADLATPAAETAPDAGPVGYVFELARVWVGKTGEYRDWGKPQFSFTAPHAADGSIRNVRPLYTAPPKAPDAGLVEALEEREASLKALGGCGDGSCIVHIRPGMHTNGGCKCSRDWVTMQRFAYTNNRFAKAVAALSRAGERT
jgi:hypothetical protein